jgi:hypothetical protein
MQNKSSSEDFINLGYKVKPEENVTALIWNTLLNGNALSGHPSAANQSEEYKSGSTGPQHSAKSVNALTDTKKIVAKPGEVVNKTLLIIY